MGVIFSSGKEYISEENVQEKNIALKLMLGFLPHMLWCIPIKIAIYT